MVDYETRLVTVPIVTATTQSDTGRLGPWRIKRSQSVNDATSTSLCNNQEGTPTLKQFLSKLDEQCQEIHDLATFDLEKQEQRPSSTPRKPQTPEISPLTEELPSYESLRRFHFTAYKRPRSGDLLMVIVMLCTGLLFVAPAAIIYFLDEDERSLALATLEGMRQDSRFATMVGVTALLAGFNAAIAVGALAMVMKGFALHKRRVFTLVGPALLYGGLLAIWVLAIVRLWTTLL